MLTTKNPSLLTFIQERLFGITKAHLHEPKEGLGPLDTAVGKATLKIKRLHTLRADLATEYNACIYRIVATMPPEALTIKEDLRAKLEFFIDADRKKYDVRQAELALLQKEHTRLHDASKIVELLLWSEIRTAFPAISHKCEIGLASGWVVFWRDEDPDAPATLLDRLLNE